ncbi:hypothetical protein VTK73DRAFT_2589 [Phialemonium thermophilum]|uniref:Uncharacterized protein n=1 Tax=Phialemonium thermophilum TaxID=223376 RepID=A0ABR3VRY0_9PEZI
MAWRKRSGPGVAWRGQSQRCLGGSFCRHGSEFLFVSKPAYPPALIYLSIPYLHHPVDSPFSGLGALALGGEGHRPLHGGSNRPAQGRREHLRRTIERGRLWEYGSPTLALACSALLPVPRTGARRRGRRNGSTEQDQHKVTNIRSCMSLSRFY